jgi:CubicO group peptidase (beta-lactamase class C family)
LPGRLEAWKAMRIHQLMSYMAAIPNYTGEPDFDQKEPLHCNVERFIVMFRDKPLDFARGTDWNSSNSGYVLLGTIVEKSPVSRMRMCSRS